ncbi:MAG: hypothetical protein ACI88A_001810 [Paraglaciecola sp.]|jgi:hypothetical protein
MLCKIILGLFGVILLLSCPTAIAHEQSAHTLSYNHTLGSPAATINDVSWISGYWQGQAWGGETEEIWSRPAAGSLMGSFKFAQDGKVKFYELIIIREFNDSLILQLKHFSDELVGWEEKDQTVDFKLVKLGKNIVYFDGYTYEKVSDDEMNTYVVIENNGQAKETKFNFKRLK